MTFPLAGDIPAWMQSILLASAQASVLAVLVLCLQPLLRRAGVPARWRFALWMLAIVRFMPLPLPESPWSLYNWMPCETAAGAPVAALPAPVLKAASAPLALSPASAISPAPRRNEPSGSAGASSAGWTLAAPSPAIANVSSAAQAKSIGHFPEVRKPLSSAATIASTATRRFQWAAGIYLLGATGIFLRILAATWSLRRIVRRSHPTDDPLLLTALAAARAAFHIRRRIPLLLSDRIASPALVGLLRPRLLLPRNIAPLLSDEELRHVFLHECAHLHRRDVLLNYVLAAVSIVQWFNPLFWFLVPRIRADRELATDEQVLLHTSDPASYGHTLLKMLQAKAAAATRRVLPVPASVGIIESKTLLARRIQMIAKFRKQPSWLTIPGLMILAVAATGTLTAPMTQAAQEVPVPVAPAPVMVEPVTAPPIPRLTPVLVNPNAPLVDAPVPVAPAAPTPAAAPWDATPSSTPASAAPASLNVPLASEGRAVKTIRLRHADALDLLRQIRGQFPQSPSDKAVYADADARSNTLAVNALEADMPKVMQLIDKVEGPPEAARPPVTITDGQSTVSADAITFQNGPGGLTMTANGQANVRLNPNTGLPMGGRGRGRNPVAIQGTPGAPGTFGGLPPTARGSAAAQFATVSTDAALALASAPVAMQAVAAEGLALNAPQENSTQVYRLQNAKADDVAAKLRQIGIDDAIAADQRTNALLVTAPPSRLVTITATVKELDTAAARPSPLDTPIPDLAADQQSLEKVLNFLGDSTHSNIVVNWAALGTASVDRNSPVSLRLKDVPLAKVLHTVLDIAAGGTGKLDFQFEDGVITISSAADLASKAVHSPQWAKSDAAGFALLGQRRAAQLDQLEQQRQQLAARGMAPGNPQIQQIDAQIQDLQKSADERAKQQAAAKAQLNTNVYDVRELIGVPPQTSVLSADQRAAVEELVHTLKGFLGPDDSVSAFNGMVVIASTDDGHKKVRDILAEFRDREAERRKNAPQTPTPVPVPR